MNVSYNWLKTLVPFTESPEEIADKLTFVGLSVEGIEYFNKGISGVVVGQVMSMENHPDPKHTKWHVCRVDAGAKGEYTVICGAPNVAQGIKVPFAMIGADLPGGFHIEEADKSGVISYGMLCSAEELGIPEGLTTPESDGGIFILPDELTNGEDIVTALELDDAILEFELTPNRADCLSVINVAREISAITHLPLTMPEVTLPAAEGNIADYASVEVKDKDLCPRYTGKMVRGIKFGNSPLWMRHRLAASGIRSISNVVDISNYVMLEMNQPNHTFDFDTLAGGKVVVRRAQKGEKITTLDSQERDLTEDMLLICDAERPIGVAGVMGGLDTEITGETKNILIESAYFYPKSIRLTGRALGLPSESSARFEKGIDIEACERASERICQLLCEYAGGTLVEGTIDSCDIDFVPDKVDLIFDHARSLIGVDVSDEAIAGFMTDLAFDFEKIDGGVRVTVPFYRTDIKREVDLIEEVARLNGYDKIPASLHGGRLTEGKKNRKQRITDKVRDLMVGMGFDEIVTYTFMNKNNYDFLLLPEDDERRNSVKIMNPFSDEQGVVRTLILPGILKIAAGNINRRNLNVSFFELASAYYPVEGEKMPGEQNMLAALVSGRTKSAWNKKESEMDFYHMKGVVETLFRSLHIDGLGVSAEDPEPFLHPGRSCRLFLNGREIGFLGEVHPLVCKNYGIPQRACVFQLNMDEIIINAEKEIVYEAISKFPAVNFDLAFVADNKLPAGAIRDLMLETGGEYLQNAEVFDIYEDEKLIKDSKRSLAYNLTFSAKDRTLKAEEVNGIIENIIAALKEKYGIELRS